MIASVARAHRASVTRDTRDFAGRGLALITVTGRRSGRRYTFPVGYQQDGNKVRINVGWPQRKHWWRNLTGGDRVEMLIRGNRRVGDARAQGDERAGVTVEVQLEPDPTA